VFGSFAESPQRYQVGRGTTHVLKRECTDWE
jgi:hypothetical protein